jgi:quinol-cytochrome oxidoreductase complex cytochrome b subunit
MKTTESKISIALSALLVLIVVLIFFPELNKSFTLHLYDTYYIMSMHVVLILVTTAISVALTSKLALKSK